jgi:hypothetical protein
VVLILFVAATVLVLSDIHPTSAKPSASAPISGPTTTTGPTHPTTTTTTFPPNRVPVLVANASGVTGAAAAVATELQAGGWDLLPPVDASSQVPASHVYYVAGFEHEAASIASSLHLPPTAVGPYTTAAPIASIGTAEAVVVVGPDIASTAVHGAATTTTVG